MRIGLASLVAFACMMPVTAHAVASASAAEPPSGIVPNAPDPTAPGATIKDDGIISDGVDVVERLGERAAIDVPLVNQDGKTVRLRDYLGTKPVIVTLVYYRCPVLCSVLLSGLTKALRGLEWQIGKEYDVLTISIDPGETSDLAKEKRRGYMQSLGHSDAENAWPFFTGSVEAVDALSASLGFKFKYVDRERQFAHVAALFFLAPDGKITRYLYDVKYDPKDIKLALFESAHGKVGTALDRILLRCYKFDSSARKYHLWIKTYYRVWGVLIMLSLGILLGVLWRRDMQRSREHNDKGTT
ncbi:MAG: SCO family protein [Polyangia bacterium]